MNRYMEKWQYQQQTEHSAQVVKLAKPLQLLFCALLCTTQNTNGNTHRETERAESIKYINVPQMQTKLTAKHHTTTMTTAGAATATTTASTKTSGWQEISRIKYGITCQHFNSMGRRFFVLWMSEWVQTVDNRDRIKQDTYVTWIGCNATQQMSVYVSSNTSGEWRKFICFSHSGDIIINQSFCRCCYCCWRCY